MKDILIKDVTIVTMDASDRIIEDGAIVINSGLIEYVGTKEELPDGVHQRVLSCPNHVVIPGLINAHTHSPMSLMRGYADDMPLQEWLFTKIFPIEDKMSAEDMYIGSMLSCIEMIKSGTTAFADMYFNMDKVAQAVSQIGIRASLASGLSSSNEDIGKAITNVEDFCNKYNGAASGRITTMIGPHAPYTCKPELLKDLAKLAKSMGVGIHIHLSENQKEVDDIRKEYGLSPVEYVNSTGIFSNHTIAAHCVVLSKDDISILKDNDVKAAHNPVSNMKLASGISPVVDLIKAGVVVGLGTDSPTSNNNLDMLQEVRTASLLQKVLRLDALALPAMEALKLATIEGAKCLGLEDSIGSLEVGKKADMAFIDFSAVHLMPLTDVVSNIVYSSSGADVDTVIIDGKIIMEDRMIKSVDESEVVQRFNDSAKRLLRK